MRSGFACVLLGALVVGCVPLGGPPEETFEPMVVGVVAEVATHGRVTALVLEDGTELRVDHIVAFEDSAVAVHLERGDLVLYSDDVDGNQWMRVGYADEAPPCWVFKDGYAWDGGDRWIFQSGLSLETAPGYELPYTDEPGGWASNISHWCLDDKGRITEGPWPLDR